MIDEHCRYRVPPTVQSGESILSGQSFFYVVLSYCRAPAVDLSAKARALLLKTAQDPAGLILKLTTLSGGAFLKSNGRSFGDGTAIEQARWETAIQQLLRFGLIEPGGDRVFCITLGGSHVADGLRRR